VRETLSHCVRTLCHFNSLESVLSGSFGAFNAWHQYYGVDAENERRWTDTFNFMFCVHCVSVRVPQTQFSLDTDESETMTMSMTRPFSRASYSSSAISH
jgi:hypothetical protein